MNSERATPALPGVDIRVYGLESTPGMRHALDRLREGLSRAYDVPPVLRIDLADVARSLPAELVGVGHHGLDGAQAHRVVVEPGRVVLLGHGTLGVAYAVERFRRQWLRLDPLAYWLGLSPKPTDPVLAPGDVTVSAPVFRERVFFENDADELINWSGRRLQLEWPHWKQLIDTLVALGYSGLQVFDSAGRSEFVYWDYYRANARYELDAALLGRVLEYAHEKGLLLTARMDLAWPFRRLPADHTCWSQYDDEWKAIWRHYLTATPLRHADVLEIGICDPLWDGNYRCRCEQCAPRGRVAIEKEIATALAAVIREVAPSKRIGMGTYGRTAVEFDAADASRAVLESADGGYAFFDPAAEPPPGMTGAVYIHAGYWLDHTVLNPYVRRLGDSLRRLAARQATQWVRVNGQSFRPCMLMVEAAAAAAWAPEAFDSDGFVRAWAHEHLGPGTAEPFALYIEALLALNEATLTTGKERGYVKLLIHHIYPLLREIAGDDGPAPDDLVRCRDTDSILRCFQDGGSSLAHADSIVEAAHCTVAAADAVRVIMTSSGQAAVCDDTVVFPARLFAAAAELYQTLVTCRDAQRAGTARAETVAAAVAATQRLWDLHLAGPDHPQWREWYLPLRQRIFGTPPSPELARRAQRFAGNVTSPSSIRPAPVSPTGYPHVVLTNGVLGALVYLPDSERGYYRGTRFDWSGLVAQVTYGTHSYLGELRPEHDPTQHDHAAGLAEEFDINNPPGYDEAAPGETFVKIGVGHLRRDGGKYAFSRKYAMVAAAPWVVTQGPAWIAFEQTLADPRGWGYRYTKRVELTPGRPELTLRRTLLNTGTREIDTEHYSHNMFCFDGRPVGRGYRVWFPFAPTELPSNSPARIAGGCLEFTAASLNRAFHMSMKPPVPGTGNRFDVRHTGSCTAVSVASDRSPVRFVVYAEGTAVCPEAFVRLVLAPGATASWTTRLQVEAPLEM